ncbi:MAG TPA: DMT family transporter [Pyrinomonadaceae bacterium]|nr:DMT family transporter [Pyrinomonadaceae bacterium]
MPACVYSTSLAGMGTIAVVKKSLEKLTIRSLAEHGITPHLVLVAVQIMFGTWPIFGKIVLRSISSTSLVGLRVCGAAVVLTLFRRQLGRLLRLPRRILAWVVLSSLLGVVLNQLLFVKGLSLTTAINASLITTTIPVFTLAVSIALGHDRASLRHVLGIGLAAAGVIYLVDPLRASFSAQTTLGNILIVINSFSYGAYIAVSRDLFRRYGALDVITWIFLVGAIITLPFAGYAWTSDELSAVPWGTWLIIAYIIIVPTVGAYYLNSWAVIRVSPSIVAIYVYLQPLLAFGFAPMILGESWNSRTLVACALIFAGVGVVTIYGRSRAVKEVSEHPDALAH